MKLKLLRQLYYMSRLAFYSIVIQFTLGGMLVAGDLSAQLKSKSLEEINWNLKIPEASLDEVLSLVQSETGFSFALNENLVNKDQRVKVKFKKGTLGDLLRALSKETNIKFKRINDQIHVATNTGRGERVEDKYESIKADITISGKITNEYGQALPGASVVQKGTTNGAITDLEGNYKLTVPEGAIITISFVGYITQEIPVGAQSTINVQMEPDFEHLEEVVVIGYGTTLKKDLTGSVSSIKAEDAYVAPVADLSQALQGRASGVFVTSIDGAPGTGTTIRIRGGNSITAGNEPLYVIDGFIGGGNLSTINPNDIESIEILKDASSTAIYGARGANGVVLITTKKGRPYEKRLNIKTSMGTQVLPKKLNLQNAREYAEYRNKFVPGLFDLNNLPGGDTDWQEVLTRSALISDNLVSLSSGNENTQFYLSTGFLNQEGILLGTAFERYSLRLNLDHKISKTFKVGTNLFLTHSLTDNSVISGRNDIAREDPLKPVFDEEGNFQVFNVGIDNGGGNPFADARLITNETIRDRVLINNYIEADIIEGLKLRTTLGGDFSFDKTNIFIPSTVPDQIIASRLGSAQIGNARTVSLLNENTLNYLKTFGDHSLSVLVGATAQTSQTELSTINAAEIPNDGVEFNAVELAPLEETTIDSGYSEFSLFSLLGRINYSYKDKYYLTFSARRDGSSRLGINNKYATFPSVAVAWRLSDEQFMSGVDFVNDLKLRSSYGITGNSGIDEFSTLAQLGTSPVLVRGGVPSVGLQQTVLSNPNIKWETTRQFDLGLEVSLFNSRLNLEFDYYYKRTNDLLLDVEVPFFTGFATQLQNIGEVENRGFDFSLNAFIIDGNDFTWSTSFNISTFKNKVLDLGGNESVITNRLPNPSNDITSQLIVGEPVGIFWGFEFEGINPATGDAIFADISGPDGVVDANDQTVIGSANPDFFGGIQNTLTYKHIDLSFFLQGVFGNENYYLDLFQVTGTQLNSFADLRDRIWTPENPDNALIPGFNSASFNSSNSFFVRDAGFIRLRTLQLGYTLPESVLKGVNNLRISFTGTNLFLLKGGDYIGYDPEVSGFGTDDVLRGYDNVNYPQNRSFVFGLDITF